MFSGVVALVVVFWSFGFPAWDVNLSLKYPTYKETITNRQNLMPRDFDEQSARDSAAGFDLLPHFRRFSQKNDVFCRSFWDADVRTKRSDVFYETYRKPLKRWKKADGYTQKDYAFRNASWHVADIFAELKEDQDRREGFLDEFTLLRDGAGEKFCFDSPREASREIKFLAKEFGADLVGITNFDERWIYTRKFSREKAAEKLNELPEGLTHVIVMGQAMDYDLIKTVPSALSGAATGLGYSRDALVLLALSQYIRNLGYQAIPSMNDTALAIPLAIKAGLGEYGRHGLLITKEFGPRVRLGKIFTDLPLTPDQPVRFGVRKFCEICRRCTQACPPKAIPDGAPSDKTHNRSNIIGVRKWSVDGEKCFRFWANQNSDCSICIRVCPYNKDYSKRIFRIGGRLAGTFLRKLMLKLDIWLGFGGKKQSRVWWRGKN